MIEHDELLQEQIKTIVGKIDALEKGSEEIKNTLSNIRVELSKYKGFIGGIMFVGSCLVAFIEIPKEWYHKLFL